MGVKFPRATRLVVKIAGRSYWLWRAVDQHGVVLEEILQSKRDKRAAKRLLIKLMKRWGFVPKRIITDKLRSYGAAKREVAPRLDHWSHKGLNNRAENSHLPFRKRERVMQRLPITGWITTLRVYAVCNPQSFLCPSPPSFRPDHSLPSARSVRSLEIRGTCRLINDRHANLLTRRVNVTTPLQKIRRAIYRSQINRRSNCLSRWSMRSMLGVPSPPQWSRPGPRCPGSRSSSA